MDDSEERSGEQCTGASTSHRGDVSPDPGVAPPDPDDGATEWNRWRRRTYAQDSLVVLRWNRPGIDLSGFDLSDLVLMGSNLRDANLSEADLSGASLEEANLSRANLSDADLLSANLSRADLSDADLAGADLSRADLTDADLSGADLSRANLRGANLSGAILDSANLSEATMSGAMLSRADLSGANLSGVNLRRATLTGANLSHANLSEAALSRADLSDADLRKAHLLGAQLVGANIAGADLTGAKVYGASVWDLSAERAIQDDLVITPRGQTPITVDNLQLAQLVYLLLDNAKFRDVVDVLTSKIVLILGRFTEERKAVLDAMRTQLRKQNYSPIVFDFELPTGRDMTETVALLASMAAFVIADLTDPRSIPQEIQAIAPHVAVPIQPVVLAGQEPWAMFDDLRRKHHWVLEPYEYRDRAALIGALPEVIAPAEAKRAELSGPRERVEPLAKLIQDLIQPRTGVVPAAITDAIKEHSVQASDLTIDGTLESG